MNQIEKNTVPSENQLKKDFRVSFENENGNGKRVLFVGNSITRHAPSAEIGWHGDWGMAASVREKDYVHIIIKEVQKTDPDAAFCICQAADWEREYNSGNAHLQFENARNFGADVIIMRIIENCPRNDFDNEDFYREYIRFIDYLNPKRTDNIILTTGFWHYEVRDAQVRKVARDKGYKLVELGDLGELDEMKAIGLFEHEGVANHPGDKGMETIAKRILKAASLG